MRAMKTSVQVFLAAAVLILAVAAFFRLTGLELKPIHHDECVNYVFTRNLVKDLGSYKYNPTAYHGPFIYYLDLPVVELLGFSKTSLRLMPAIWSLLTVVLVLLMVRSVGPPGALFAAALLALSPADIFYGKTYLHEVYFTFGFVGCVWAMLEAGRTGKAWAVIAFYLMLMLSFLNKETAAFHVIVFGVAIGIAWFVSRTVDVEEPFDAKPFLGWPEWQPLAFALTMSAALFVLFYTSLFHNAHGLIDFFKSYMPWFQTGVEKPQHVKVWSYFFKLIGEYYWPALPFALWGAGRAIVKFRPRGIALFVVAALLVTVYSLIPYKTPWCLISMGVAWILLSAEGFTDLWNLAPGVPGKALLTTAAVGLLACYGFFSYHVNFLEFDDNYNAHEAPIKHDIVYVQTERAYEKLYDDLARIAEVDGRGKDLPISLSAGSKNPGRFYLREYRKVATIFFLEKLPKHINQDVVLVRDNELAKEKERFDGDYRSFGLYPVFPGWKVHIMVKEDLWQKLAAAGMINEPSPPS
jgi:uncharacterized protein (TIGR03663 family)